MHDSSSVLMTSYFSLDERLMSCKVSKELILSIEAHLRKVLERYFKAEDVATDRKPIWVRIHDSVGTESIESIASYSPYRFPDDVKSIRIDFSASNKTNETRIDVKVTFDERIDLSGLHVTCANENAREIAMGIRDGITLCLSAAKNSNSIYHLPAGWQGGLWVLFYLSIGIVIGSVIQQQVRYAQYALIVLTILFFVLKIAPVYRPYMAFDSESNDRKMERWKFWVGGTISFLVFELFAHSIVDMVLHANK